MNAVQFGTGISFEFSSDRSQIFRPLLPDGATVTGLFMIDFSDGTSQTYDGQFIDLGDAVTTPDTGSTLGLLGLALAGLFGASHIRSLWAA